MTEKQDLKTELTDQQTKKGRMKDLKYAHMKDLL